jgi:hypothetical protein
VLGTCIPGPFIACGMMPSCDTALMCQ